MRALALAALACAVAAPAIAVPRWTGRYIYEESLGRDLSGTTALFITHTLTLSPGGGCSLLTEGVQTYVRVRCRTVRQGDALAVLFRSYDDRDGANGLGPRQYRPGTALFTLTPTNRGLVTRWQGYERAPKGPRAGRYFRRS